MEMVTSQVKELAYTPSAHNRHPDYIFHFQPSPIHSLFFLVFKTVMCFYHSNKDTTAIMIAGITAAIASTIYTPYISEKVISQKRMFSGVILL